MTFRVDPWIIEEEGLDREKMRVLESLTSTGNGYMGLRGSFEEDYSGDSCPGFFLKGIWYPEKDPGQNQQENRPVRIGRTVPKMTGIHVELDGIPLDLNLAEVEDFRCSLNLHKGLYHRCFTVKTSRGKVRVEAERFVSFAQRELVAIRYAIRADYPVHTVLRPFLDIGDENGAWEAAMEEETEDTLAIVAHTREISGEAPHFTVCAAMSCWADGLELKNRSTGSGTAEMVYSGELLPGETAALEKYVLVFTDQECAPEMLTTFGVKAAARARELGYSELKAAHTAAWEERWQEGDVRITGDEAAQQGIRFSLFQLFSNISAEEPDSGITRNGFSGEKGGTVPWDMEAVCLPAVMGLLGEEPAKQLLRFRLEQLDAARENSGKQKAKGALYPLETVTGSECCQDKEKVAEAIHRSSAVAHAFFSYATCTGNYEYLQQDAFEALRDIARFYTDRALWNEEKACYELLGVMGPDEHGKCENNNWYTNRMAAWSIGLFATQAHRASEERLSQASVSREELTHMLEVMEKMASPEDPVLKIFLQSDDNSERDEIHPADAPAEERPGVQSPLLQQADVLQGLYCLNHLYKVDVIRKNFDYYEPRTIHENELSPYIHSILASQLGYRKKAMQLYHKTDRLDLDFLSVNPEEGLHLFAMAGNWLMIAQGFGGMRTVNGLSLSPYCPDEWQSYSFSIHYRGRRIRIYASQDTVVITLLEGKPVKLQLFDEEVELQETIERHV